MNLKELKEQAEKDFFDAWKRLSLYGVDIFDSRSGIKLYPDNISFQQTKAE